MWYPFEFQIALRYLKARRKAGVSITGLLTILGIAFGVWALTVVTSVFNGFQAEFLEKLLGINSHVVVLRPHSIGFFDYPEVTKALEENPDVLHASPFIYSEVITQSPSGVQGVAVKGIDATINQKLPLAKYLGDNAPSILSRLGDENAALPGILIGRTLKDSLHVNVGDTVTIISPYGGKGNSTKTATFEIVGIFHSGMHDFDSKMTFISLPTAQIFFHMPKAVTGIEVWTHNPLTSRNTVPPTIQALAPNDPYSFQVRDWSITNRGLFGAFQLQKTLISLVLFFIVIVAAFNIMATLILLILEKGKEIAILKSLGANPRSILSIFIIDGQIVGLMGCLLGIGLGLITCAILEQYGLKARSPSLLFRAPPDDRKSHRTRKYNHGSNGACYRCYSLSSDTCCQNIAC